MGVGIPWRSKYQLQDASHEVRYDEESEGHSGKDEWHAPILFMLGNR